MGEPIAMWKTLSRLAVSCAIFVLVASSLAAPPSTAEAEQNGLVALVVGNSQYDKIALRGPSNDAADLSTALRKSGFTVTNSDSLTNLSRKNFFLEFDSFARRLTKDSVALFYYSGLGVRDELDNYLIPVDVPAGSSDNDVNEFIALSSIIKKLAKQEVRAVIIVLDVKTLGDPIGLNALSDLAGHVRVFYASQPGKSAMDAKPGQRNSAFTAALLRAFDETRAASFDDVFDRAAALTAATTGKTQVPWSAGSLAMSAPLPPLASAREEYLVRTVYFATDRKVLKSDKKALIFESEKTADVKYGHVSVSIPRDHRLGQLESPSIWHLEFREDPEKHVVVLDSSLLSRQEFFNRIRGEVTVSRRRSLLVFIHGFNVGFDEAARRTAQMAYDLGFDGVPMFFSWPSQDSVLNYTVDEQSVIDAEPDIANFLRDILLHSSADRIYLIAHSMGNRGLTRALINVASSNPDDIKRIREVILAAPDIGSVEFTEQIAPNLKRLGAPITLYASSNDNALAISKRLHGGARAGETGKQIVLADGIETVDASNTSTDLVGHSYYGDRRSVLSDMWYLINGELRASERCCLRAAMQQGRTYWIFVP